MSLGSKGVAWGGKATVNVGYILRLKNCPFLILFLLFLFLLSHLSLVSLPPNALKKGKMRVLMVIMPMMIIIYDIFYILTLRFLSSVPCQNLT